MLACCHMPNRLAHESSPYLLQHANNPVDWYAWSDEAFQRARELDRPIFLSVGYSTCHWCHVMERESFEHDEIAQVLNADFVSIKVDREERPDVDRVYMTFVQATSGSGGWPMSVWLTPDLKPFYGGTYFPPTSRWGRPGFVDVLREISNLWRNERARVLESAEELTTRLREATGQDTDDGDTTEGASEGAAAAPPIVAGVEALREAVTAFHQSFDRRFGGFGQAPKFPRPSEILFLLREHARTGDETARDMALDTLRAMAVGGMRDQIGGGFHRYSVDGAWRVPHFEKMLYDQAQLVLAYLEAAQVTQDDFYAVVAEDTLQYVRRELMSREGAFYSAEDADSVPPEAVAASADPATANAANADPANAEGASAHPHKAEGAFYIWSASEIDALLGPDEGAIVRARYGMLPGGNAPHDPQDEFTGKNLLYIARSVDDIAKDTGRSPEDVIDVLGRARATLFEARAKRPRPHLDDKVLTAWNGLMIAAFARAARALEPWSAEAAAASLRTATRAAAAIRTHLWNAGTRTLLRRYRDGQAAIDAYSEDYASLTWGVLELFQTTGRVEWLEWALALQRRLDEWFWDDRDGGWFNTTGRDPSVLLRLKEDYDGAEPSATSIALQNLLLLSHATDLPGAPERVERTLGRFGDQLGRAARAVPFMLANLETWHAGVTQVVIVGPRDREDTVGLREALASQYLPFTLVVPVEPGEAQDALARLMPWIGAMTMVEGRATAYVCRHFACERPVTSAEDMLALLDGPQ